jgi:protein arginine kinase activator
MICEKCQKRPAKVHLTKIVNGVKNEVHLCEQCAQEFEGNHFFAPEGFSVHSLLASFFGNQAGESADRNAHTIIMGKSCPACGATFEDFRTIGRLGCARCYQEFAGELKGIIKRVHGNEFHCGKIPKRKGGSIRLKREIKSLREKLNAAVLKEEFEEAAALRDQIRELEQKMDDLKGQEGELR